MSFNLNTFTITDHSLVKIQGTMIRAKGMAENWQETSSLFAPRGDENPERIGISQY